MSSQAAIEVHTLCYRLDYLAAIWALKSFYWSSGIDFPLVIHISGRTDAKLLTRLSTHFPNARIIPQNAADSVIEDRLARAGFRRLLDARRQSPFMLKLTDLPLLASGEYVLGIDSDVLFFASPREILDACERRDGRYLFQRDPESSYNVSEADAAREFGIRLVPRVNTGIMLYPCARLDLTAFERYLAYPAVARSSGYIEQTLYALHASEGGDVAFLPPSYVVDLRAGMPYEGIVARHYAGLSRPLLTHEGMPRLLNHGLLGVSNP